MAVRPDLHPARGRLPDLEHGADVRAGSQPNTSSGFEEAGFQTAINSWLRDCFPSRQSGGFICVLDNLELLQTYQAACDLLEALRDSAFNMPGLRWVLCGARGIMRSAASSSRFAKRIEVGGVDWPDSPDDKRQTLEVWMARTAEKYLDAAPSVGARVWEVFEGIVERGGSISPSDFADFGADV